MEKFINIDIQQVDITQFEADVVALKFAGVLTGAAKVMARTLGKTDEDIKNLLPSIGSMRLLPGNDRIKANRILFFRMVSLSAFDYREAYRFSFDILKGLSRLTPQIRHLALTLHSTGFDRDTYKVLKYELNGFKDAVDDGDYPPDLERITIIDRSETLVRQCQTFLKKLLPSGQIVTFLANEPIKESNNISHNDNHPDDEFDVFISYKSEDIDNARTVYDHLISNNYRIFFSKESLPQMGSTEYHEQIDSAIEKAQHMVVITSKSEYVRSKWVEYEWRLFQGEKLAGRKAGNLVTIISGDMSINDLPISLRNREVIPLNQEGLKNLLGFIRKSSGREDK